MPSSRYAVIGDPIDHSLSPAMHRAAFAAAGIDATYESVRVRPGELSGAVQSFRDRAYTGFNVTIPHKQTILSLLDGLAPAAAEIRAVNTVTREGDRLVGHNTDVEGFAAALDAVAPGVQGGRAVVFGAGGAARAVVAVTTQREMALTVVNRDRRRAQALAADYAGTIEVAEIDEVVRERIAEAQLIVNATPLGMSHLADRSPLPADSPLREVAVVIDLVYGRETPLLRAARRQGCRTQDGLEMLVRQAARAFWRWTGVDPDIEIMREACLVELRERQVCSVS